MVMRIVDGSTSNVSPAEISSSSNKSINNLSTLENILNSRFKAEPKEVTSALNENYNISNIPDAELANKIRDLASKAGIVYDDDRKKFSFTLLERAKQGLFVTVNDVKKLSYNQKIESLKSSIDAIEEFDRKVNPVLSDNTILSSLFQDLAPKDMWDILLHALKLEEKPHSLISSILTIISKNEPKLNSETFQYFIDNKDSSLNKVLLEKFTRDTDFYHELFQNPKNSNKEFKYFINDFMVKDLRSDADFNNAFFQKFSKTMPHVLLENAELFRGNVPLTERISLARSSENSSKLAKNIYALFTDKEIVQNPQVLESFKLSKNKSQNEKTISYLNKVELSINNLMQNSLNPEPLAPQRTLPDMYRVIGSNGQDRILELRDVYDPKSPRENLNNQKKISNLTLAWEIFPAITPHPSDYKSIFNRPDMQALGFKFESGKNGDFITLPEPATFINRWNEYHKDKSDVKKFEIKIVDGTATVAEFNKAFYASDVLSAINEEFIHDVLAHVIATAICKLDSSTNEYESCMMNARDAHKNANKAIEEYAKTQNTDDEKTIELIEILKYITGIFADGFTAINNLESRYDLIDNTTNTISFPSEEAITNNWSTPLWKKAYEKANNKVLGSTVKKITDKEVLQLWKTVMQTYAQRLEKPSAAAPS